MNELNDNYPAQLNIDYPEKLDRFSTFFRIFMIIPIAIVLALVSGSNGSSQNHNWRVILASGGITFAATVLMILFRRKYPKWWFDWNLNLTKFSARVGAYLFLLRDEYPSTDEEQAVHLNIIYPDAEKDLHQWLPLVKWFLAIPHYIVLAFLYIALFFVLIIAWFAIVFTGVYPTGLFDFTVGVMRWSLRVSAYAFILATDKYPPFRLS